MAAVQNRIAKSIYIIDPRPIGGMVFGATDDDIMCNTPVDVSSIDRAYSSDLLDYLKHVGVDAADSSYVPRRVIGDYIKYNFRKYLQEATRSGINVLKIDSSCSRINALSRGRYELVLSGHTVWPTICATDVILCTGHGLPKVPLIFGPYSEHFTFFRSPYPEAEMLAKVPASSDVLIIGSKQTAMDATLLLCREGHRVTMLSPSGELPAVRRGFAPSYKFPIEQSDLRELIALWCPDGSHLNDRSIRKKYLLYLARTLRRFSNTPVSRQFSKLKETRERLSEEIHIADDYNCRWEDLIISYVDAINSIYFDCKEVNAHDFQPGFRRKMMRYIAAAALPNAKKILKHIGNDVLAVKQGNVTNIQASQADGKAWKVRWDGGEGRFDAVVCATGFQNHHYYFDDAGALVLDSHHASAVGRIDIAHDLSIRNPRTNKRENIWVTGSATHHRILTSSAIFLSIPQVTAAMNSMVNAVYESLGGEHDLVGK
ncbi:hypothetical protein C5748_25840 [Phyllobacterium phragmitis]|uniref:FAD-dependent urate hydroxylase HpyO/Asp monooxygenase CreE-like FAD/NAD(P)-binding domain-containing protein n=2 Tax=Phyllobacterium phragmitis TaxID=2670329 RepID=A0A2S9IJC4_9HYPH|nr:hypothetical protein C5748_25840 [Phyllobacterium phragmitis]